MNLRDAIDHARSNGFEAIAFKTDFLASLLDVVDAARAACPELNGERHGALHAALDRLAALEDTP